VPNDAPGTVAIAIIAGPLGLALLSPALLLYPTRLGIPLETTAIDTSGDLPLRRTSVLIGLRPIVGE
jgi:hypothetical protein